MEPFGKEQASSYDKQFARLAPLKDALHLLIRLRFTGLPERSRILCVGAGTGAEMIALAKAFPKFEFMAVEPSLPMMEICEQRVHEEGMASRCQFHNGYIHTLPPSDPFDAATSVLVSQFLIQRAHRIAFFDGIAQRLRPDALLVNADLCADLESEEAARLAEVWREMLLFTGTPADKAGGFLEGWKKSVAVLPPAQVADIMASGGFQKPILFYQSLFIHAWYSRRQVG